MQLKVVFREIAVVIIERQVIVQIRFASNGDRRFECPAPGHVRDAIPATSQEEERKAEATTTTDAVTVTVKGQVEPGQIQHEQQQNNNINCPAVEPGLFVS